MRFRLWDPATRKMIYPGDPLEKNYLINLSGEVIFVDWQYYQKYCCNPITKLIVMESSYKYDLNNNEIYYGDILKPVFDNAEKNIILNRDTVVNGFLGNYKIIGNQFQGKLL